MKKIQNSNLDKIMKLAVQSSRAHYLARANPYKTIDSLSEFINNNLHLTSNKNVALINKPPGFVLSSKIKINFLNHIKLI